MTTATRSRSRSASSPNRTPEVRLSPKQHAFCTSTSRFPLYRGAIRSGKTYAGAIRSIARRYQYPGTIEIIGGPSWDQVRDGTMVTLRRLINPRCIVEENKNEHYWLLDNGSIFRFRTVADPDILRALEAHDLWLDEIAMCPGGEGGALDIAMPRISLNYPDPTFVNSLWGTTTPRGMDWTLDVWGQDGKPGYEVVHSTIYDNRPNLPEGLIESLEAKYRDTPFFEQELLGMYTAFEGLVYPMFRKDVHVKHDPWPLTASERVVVGVDFGGIVPTAMGLWGLRNGRKHLFAEFYRTGATIGDIGAQLYGWAEQAQIPASRLRVACDWAEQVTLATLREEFDAVAADKDRMAGIRYFGEQLTGRWLTISPSCVHHIAEFGQYIWARKRNAETKVVHMTDNPIDHHGDAMDEGRYALMELAQTEEHEEQELGWGWKT
jgi:phage terminase large subunit-like protein